MFTLEVEIPALDAMWLSWFSGVRLTDYQAHGKTVSRVLFPNQATASLWIGTFDESDRPVALSDPTLNNPDLPVIVELDTTEEDA